MPKYKESSKQPDRGSRPRNSDLHAALAGRRAPFPTTTSTTSGSGGESLSMHHPRRSLGGRGREWASESHKLLEAMLELDDSKPFREPIDPLKYPEYYTVIERPLDLSQILLSLHRGAYESLDSFATDMRLMFNNYKAFFTDANSETYAMVHRLSFWFESELVRIKNRRLYKNQHGNLMLHIGEDQERRLYPPLKPRPRPGSLEARILALQEDNIRTLATSPMSLSPQATPPHSDLGTDDHIEHPHLQKNATPQQKSDQQPNTNIILSIGSGPCTILQGQDTPSRAPDPRAHDRSYSAPVGTPSTDGFSMRQPPTLQPIITSEPSPVPAVDRYKISDRVSLRSKSQGQSQGHTSVSSSSALDLRVDVTNIWFGLMRCKPLQPVLITEQGIIMQLKLEDREETVSITLAAEELVRCCAHFGRGRRHTVFFFVLPSFIKRLVVLSPKFGQMQGGLIAMFISTLSTSQMSRLVHLLWSMGRRSMFGQLFTEVDQKSALALLANIKPTIMDKIPDKYRDSVGAAVPDVTHHNSKQHVIGSSSSSSLSLSSSSKPHTAPSSDRSRLSSSHGLHSGGAGESLATTPLSSLPHGLHGQGGGESLAETSDRLQSRLRMVIHKQKEGDWSAMRLSPALHASQDSSDPTTTEENCTFNELRDMFLSIKERLDKTSSSTLTGALRDGGGEEGSPRVLGQEEGADSSTLATIDSPPTVTGSEGREVDRPLVASSSTIPEQDDTDLPIDLSSDKRVSNPDKANTSLMEIADDDEESDLEIIIPSDESDHEAPIKKKSRSSSAGQESEDIVMTLEKISTKCPITQQTMKNPVKNRYCGHCYDKAGVQDLIQHRADKARCPVPGCSNPNGLSMADMRYDFDLWTQIQQTKAKVAGNSSK